MSFRSVISVMVKWYFLFYRNVKKRCWAVKKDWGLLVLVLCGTAGIFLEMVRKSKSCRVQKLYKCHSWVFDLFLKISHSFRSNGLQFFFIFNSNSSGWDIQFGGNRCRWCGLNCSRSFMGGEGEITDGLTAAVIPWGVDEESHLTVIPS